MQQNSSSSHPNDERGASLLEFAITLPLLILGVYTVIFIGQSLNARASLFTSVASGSRLAFTRAVESEMGTQLIPEVETYLSTGNPSGLDLLLASPGLEATAFSGTTGGWYMSEWNQTLNLGGDRTKLSPRYIYALIYAYRHFKQSVGGGVRFPCDPHDPVNGAGCLRCANTNATTGTNAPSASTEPIIGDPDYDYNAVGVWCEYRPADFFLLPIFRLVTGGSTIGTFVFKSTYTYRFTT